MELLDHMAVLLLSFLGSLHTVFHSGHANSHSHQQLAAFSPTFVVAYVFNDSHSNMSKVDLMWF
jgi:tRNA A37 threonylcarbamoyladenosine biosynthesis protein TsaE